MHAQVPHKHNTGGQASFCIFMSSLKQLTVASFPPASPRDGGRGTIGNSTSKYSAFMNEATLGLEWAFVSPGSVVERVRVNSPMRFEP